MPTTPAPRHGLLLASLVSIAILAALGTVAQAMRRLADRDRAAADRAILLARADALAQAGIEHALAHLRQAARDHYASCVGAGCGYSTVEVDQPLPAQRWLYKGRVTDETTGAWYDDNGAGLPLARAAFPPASADFAPPCVYGIPSFYRGNPGVGRPDDPVLATYPSAEIAEYSVGNSATFALGRGRPISGWLGSSYAPQGPRGAHVAGTYEDWGDTFALKVLDCASMVNVNMDTHEIARFLDLLGTEIDHFFRARFTKDGREVARDPRELRSMGYRYPGLALTTHTGLGAWLIPRRAARPGRRFSAKEEIAALLRDFYGTGPVDVCGQALSGPDVAREDWNKLRDFLTCHGYQDRTVLEPGSLMTNQLYARLDPTRPDREARSPIDLNTVSNPVLAAWLRGLAYHRYDEERLARGDGTSQLVDYDQKFGADALRRVAFAFRRVVQFTPIQAWLGLTELFHDATSLAHLDGDIIANGSLRAAFHETLDAAGFDAVDLDAWNAMANPNAMLNKFNPDPSTRRAVDKYDLAHWTTELTVSTMGYYEIESRGVITHDGSRVLAARTIHAVYQVYDQVTKTTQRDFELDRLATGYAVFEPQPVPLHGDGWWGVASLPEARGGYASYVEGADLDSADPTRYGYAATYDGALCHGVVERRSFAEDELACGFSTPLGRNPDATKNELDAIHPPGPTSRYLRAPTGLDTARAVATDAGPRLRIAGPDGTHPLRYDTVATGGPAALARFTQGSDAFPFGFYADALRRRALVFEAGVAAGARGAIQFWVQPRNARAHTRESWITWRDEHGHSIAIYRDAAEVRARFELGSGAGGELYYDTALATADWSGGSWHYIYVDWDRAGRLFVDGHPPTGGGRVLALDTPPTPEAPRARHVSFQAFSPEVERAVQTLWQRPLRNRGLLEWIAGTAPREPRAFGPSMRGASLWIGHDGPDAAAGFANATIDNVRVAPHPAVGFGVATMVSERFGGQRFREWPGRALRAIYWQDITSHFSGYDQDIELGSLLWNASATTSATASLLMRVGKEPPAEVTSG